MYFVYILECNDKSLYTGSTKNLAERLRAHNHLKSGAHYTKIRRPVTLVYSEICETLAESRAREAEIKRLNKNQKLELLKAGKK